MVRASKPTCIVPTCLYSAVELAAFLGIKPRTLEVWRRTGQHAELKWKRVGRRVRYLGADILHFLDDSTSPRPKAKRRRGVR
jgi:helix-turn-helix protein